MPFTSCDNGCIHFAVFVCFHNESDCHLTHILYSIWISVWKSCCWLEGTCGWFDKCAWSADTSRCVCVCARVRAHKQMILCRSAPEIMAVHTLCVDRMRRVRAVRWSLQRTQCRCGASTKLMGILGSTFRTSQIWCQKAYCSHKFVLLVWVWCTGFFVCAGSWRNGLAFNALIHAHCPGRIVFNALQRSCHIENINNAFDFGNNKLGIPRLLDAEGW